MRKYLPLLLASSALFFTACTGSPDVTAPTLTLSADPTTLTGAGSVKLSANATDNMGVTKVEFYRGNETTPFSTDAQAPYEVTETFPEQTTATTRTYRAVAYDAAGNSSQEATTTITLQPIVLGLPHLSVPGITSGTVTLIGFHYTQNVKQVLTQGTINSDSTVTISNPPEASLAPILSILIPGLPAECSGSFVSSDPNLMAAQRNYLVLNATPDANNTYTGSYLYLKNPDGSEPQTHTAYAGGYPNQLWYADRAASITADITCVYGSSSTRTVLNLNFRKGWNYVQRNWMDGNPGTNSLKTLDVSSIALGDTGYQVGF